jgi:hypothetical protein
MSKIVAINSIKDRGIASSGGGLVTVDTGFSTSRVQKPQDDVRYKVDFISSEMRQDDELPYEIARIKVSQISKSGNFASSVRLDFGPGVKDNHFFRLPDVVDIGATHTQNYSTSKSQASYSFETVFNYISEDYDNLQIGIDEQNLYSPMDHVSMQDFMNVKNRSTNIFNFSRGNAMRNYTIPTMKIKQGTDQSPYYNYLRINQRLDNTISNFTLKLGLFDELLQDYLMSDKDDLFFDIQKKGMTSKDSKIQAYNLVNFLKSNRPMDTDNFYGLEASRKPSAMSLSLRKHLIKGFLKDVSKSGFRTYKDIHSNVEAHKEVFCYSIDKHNQTLLDSTKIQTLFAPAMRESTPVIDTQVKYGKTYAYRVTGHYMIVGNSYSYNIISVTDQPDDAHAIIEVINRPNILLIPSEIFTKKINVVQLPPVFPQVTFKTQNDSSKSISLYLSQMKTEVLEHFVSLTNEDRKQAEMLMNRPGGMDRTGKVKFKTYGDQGLFQIFRMDSQPKSIMDFENALVREISMPFESMDAIFKDVVAPNKDYYYIIRSVNQKGLVSNPTSIYRVRLLVDANDSKVMVETYHPPRPRNKEDSLPFRKLLRITPAVEHVILDESQQVLYRKTSFKGSLDSLKLGTADHSVWGRKFKIRIKSKTSGKMMDIYLNVDLTKNKTQEEF